MKVVKSVKMKPPDVALLGLLSFALYFRDFGGLRYKMHNTFEAPPPTPILFAKLEGCLLPLVRWHARHAIF
jgi:hypothetical protein